MTYLSGYEISNKQPNIRVVYIPDIKIYNTITNLFTESSNAGIMLMQFGAACVKALSFEGVQSLRNEKFDLVILHAALTDCFLSFVYELKVCSFFIHIHK